MIFSDWLTLARTKFPFLNDQNSRPTSPVDDEYNCIAWAAEDTKHWWWPDPQEQNYWPAAVPRLATLDAFVQAYGFLGYVHKTDASLEPGREKIAIFANELRSPTHASRQLQDGWWTSKLGQQIDIEHELFALEGPTYGKVIIVLARIASPK